MTELNEEKFESEREEFVMQLFRTASHDLNNILSPIIGYPELMMDSFSPDSQEYEDLNEIKTLANRAIHVIKNVQMLLRPELKALRACDVNQQIRSVLEMGGLPDDARKKLETVVVKMNLADSLPAVGSSQPVLQSVLTCLFSPMLTIHTGSGPTQIRTESTGAQVAIHVVHGVPELTDDDVCKLKEPFFIKKKFSNNLTGLEIRVADELIQQHGGTYTLEYKNGELHHECRLPVFVES